MQEILLNVESKEIRVAHLLGGRLYDLILERKKTRQLTGNIYRGKVTNILRNIQSAFIDINEGENGFIHISDILENTKKFEELFDMDFNLGYDIQKLDTSENKAINIDEVLKTDQPVLVQVIKEPIGNKGARLTSNVSIAGRFLVLLPNSPHRGVSRKIENKEDRDRLKKVIRAFEMPHDMGLICRTASTNASAEELIQEAEDLFKTWQSIVEGFEKSNGPKCLYEESDLIKRTVLTAIDKGYDRILIDDWATHQQCKNFLAKYDSEKLPRLELYRDKTPIFERFNVEKEIDKALKKKIWLSSGGYLFFEQTEAMCTIDVNSGRSLSESASVEEALVRINLEAVDEIARQVRLRNIGGLVICDFIDMRSRKNQKRVLERLKEVMKDDSAKCTVLGMSEFGLVEMTRQRNRESLSQTLFVECPYCYGCGKIKSHESVMIEIERGLKKAIQFHEQYGLRLTVHPELLSYMNGNDRDFLMEIAEKLNAHLTLETDDNLHLNTFLIHSTTSGKKIEV